MNVGNGARRLRVVVLGHVARLSGAELALARLLPAMSGVDAHVILAEDGPLVERLRRVGVSVEVLPMREAARSLQRGNVRADRVTPIAMLMTLSYAIRLARRLRDLRPDLVHVNSLKALVYGSLAARMAGLPILWHSHDRITEDYLPRSAVRLVHLFARLATTVAANSRTTLESLGIAATRGVVVSSPIERNSSDARSERRSRGQTLNVGMIGRIAPWKGQHVFLEAFARAFPAGEERAVIVGAPLFGETDYEDQIRAQCSKLGLDGRVEFRGFREQVAVELANLDVLVHASTIPEPFGQVVLEGMSAGLPVVAAGAGGPAEIVRHGATGFLYPPGDTNALAATLRAVAGDADMRMRVGNAARESTACFAPDIVAAQMASAYRFTLSVARGGA